MKNRILNLAVVLFALTFLISGCQQELLRDTETQHTATQNHKFQVVKLQDIPNVVQFIKKQTGRSDLKIPMGGKKINALAKGAIEFSELETDFILKVTKEDAVYYVFGISNAGDESTLYNFEVKEVEREVVRAELIEFASDEPFDEEYSNISNFNGKVSSYNDKKELVNISYFQEGINAECPPPGSGAGGSGGDEPFEPIDPNDPDNPYSGIGGGIGGSGESGGSGSTPESVGCDANHWQYSHPIRSNGLYGDITGLMFINDCGDWYHVPVKAANKSPLSPNCNDGSGVVVLPGPKPKKPCEKIQEIGKHEITKQLFEHLKTNKVNDNKEWGIVGKEENAQIQYQELPGEQETGGIKFTFNPGIKIDFYLHTHYAGLFSVFSPIDLGTLSHWYKNGHINNTETFIYGLVTASNTQYIMIIDDPAKFNVFGEGFLKNGQVDEVRTEAWGGWSYALYNIKIDGSINVNEEGLVRLLDDRNTGLKMLKGSNNSNDWSELIYKNGKLDSIKCK